MLLFIVRAAIEQVRVISAPLRLDRLRPSCAQQRKMCASATVSIRAAVVVVVVVVVVVAFLPSQLLQIAGSRTATGARNRAR